ncbi:MAG TPA: fibronectin type III-like domain-contianing protein, partial [Bacteroidota bacterium]|nr:fibronectin type III-like domain-contianing protein [Bacteroidota bacterium]
VNPGGRLPVTIPQNVTQLPPWNDNLNDGYGCGYRWFDATGNTPGFAFGSGLSYTTFSYDALDVAPSSVAPGEQVRVSVTVTNTGLVAGDEVVQLYLSYASPPEPMPTKVLKGFRRITLTPGESQRVTFTLTAEELYFFNETTSQYEVPAGNVVVRIGRSSDTLPLTGVFSVRQLEGRPDLLITAIRTVPPYPVPGQQVLFLATVKNQGSAATQAGFPLNVTFTLGGFPVSYVISPAASIPPGGMALLCGDSGPAGSASWTAGEPGAYAVTATVDPGSTVDECVEGNNAAAHTLTVYDAPPPNLALRKSVSVTSVEGSGYEGRNAVDGNRGTRWSSAFSDPQVLVVDLGYNYRVDVIDLYWEAAYATEYTIRIAEDGGVWRDVELVTNGDGGMDHIVVGAVARRVMMVGTKRVTQYGYSLYEVEVFGGTTTGNPDESPLLPSHFALYETYPNPFNPSTTLRYDLPERAFVHVTVHTLLGQELHTVVHGEQEAGRHSAVVDGSTLATGVYVCRFQAVSEGGNVYSGVRKIVLVR